jgi:MFS transporter, DHA1 family, chloramphenicol/florfenicol resistance protein
MRNYKVVQLVMILAPFVFSFAFGLDIYIPIVPQMTEIFQTSPALVQLTLSLFLLITGAGQLIIGPLADQFGRRRIFYIASLFYTCGALGCAFALNIHWLIFARIVCAFGACGMLVTSFAVVRDLYSGDTSAKMYSFLNGAIGISPTFAPILGGYLAVYFGWQSVFFFLALIGLASLLITKKCIQETHALEMRTKINGALLKRYASIFRHRQFIIYSALAGFAQGVFFGFFSISPFIIITLLKVPTEVFGYCFAVFGSVLAIAGLASGKIIERMGIERTIVLGIALMMTGGVSMLAWHYAASLTLSGFLIPMAIACTGAMFVLGSSASGAMEPFGSIAGTASAAFGSLEFGISSLVGSLLMLFPVNSTLPYGITIVLMATSSICVYVLRLKAKPVAWTLNPISSDTSVFVED